jgi:hypothetical protein
MRVQSGLCLLPACDDLDCLPEIKLAEWFLPIAKVTIAGIRAAKLSANRISAGIRVLF